LGISLAIFVTTGCEISNLDKAPGELTPSFGKPVKPPKDDPPPDPPPDPGIPQAPDNSSPDNLLVNPSFEAGTSSPPDNWFNMSGSFETFSGSGYNYAGYTSLTTKIGGREANSNCFAINPSADLDFSGYIITPDAANGSYVSFKIWYYTDSACSSSASVAYKTQTSFSLSAANTWELNTFNQLGADVPSNANYAAVSVRAGYDRKKGDSTFRVFFDNLVVTTSGSPPPPPPPPPQYTVGGTISGLSGTVELQNNGGDNLSENSNGGFTFSTALDDGSDYNVTVYAQPSGQTCTVTSGSGNLSGADVTDVSVDCVDDSQGDTTVRLASWNIQNFGNTKSSDSGLMNTISSIVNNYDLVFVQEVHTVIGTCGGGASVAACRLVDRLNQSDRAGAGAWSAIGRNSGSGGYIEQYSTFYRNAIIDSVTDGGLANVGNFTRPPHIVDVSAGGYTFTVINIHTTPEMATEQIEDLPLVANKESDSDLIILGDYNSDGSYFNENWTTFFNNFNTSGWIHEIGDSVDTTVSTNNNYTYDRICVSSSVSAVSSGGSVHSNQIDSSVSDHYLVHVTLTVGDGGDPPPPPPPQGTAIINEVAWMGTTASSYDEWMELHNPSADEVNLSGWTLETTDGGITISLSGTIPAGGYFLLERTDDNSVQGIAADQIYTGTLANTGEVLELRNNTSTLVDSVNDGNGWSAGDSTSRATMAWDGSTWFTSADSYNGGYGTPRAAN
jgi:endonuclease/exonuclease/phosphatase family metal-dependent hydrolase